jgi:uncharacterized OsmC-like protein
MTTQVHEVNGIDVQTLLATVQAVQQAPALGAFQFRARNQWLGGTKNRSRIQGFFGAGREDDSRAEPYVMDCDEPPVLCGRDEGANPVEYLLNALAGCMTTTMVAHAASRGIAIEALDSKLEGDIDVRGFLGIAPDVPKGYRTIRVTFRVRSDADVETLRKLAQFSPVYNTITQPTKVEVRIEKA